MNRIGSVLVSGLLAGVTAHFAWFWGFQRPVAADPAAELAWMQRTLGLSAAQFERIQALHAQSGPRLNALAAQVARLRQEFAAFERERQVAGQVDFLEFARCVRERRALDRECVESTRQLILATSTVMDPHQREAYLALLGPTLAAAGPPPAN